MLGKTWLVSAISGSIAVGSCVLNDFFDYAVDSINDPNKVSLTVSHAAASIWPSGNPWNKR